LEDNVPSRHLIERMEMIKERLFAVSQMIGQNHSGDDIWQSMPIDYDAAKIILIHNGWTSEQADFDLEGCPDRWIPVNNTTQIC
jgi:hypothetical protein